MSYHATKVAKTTIGQAAKVQKLENDSQSTNKSFVLKLTAECQKAIERAIQMGWPVRMVSTKTEVKVEVGISDTSVATFTCNQQRLNGDIDAVSQGQSLKKVSPLNTKLVINATNNSFAAAQQKVVKMAELQSQKQTKNKDTKISDSSRKRSAETSSRNKNDFATPIRPASKKTKKSDMADTKTSSKVKGLKVDAKVQEGVVTSKQSGVNSEIRSTMETSGSRSTLPTSEPRSTTLTSEGRTAKNSNSKPKTITSEAKSTTVTSEARRPSSITSESRATMTTSEAKSTAINPEDRPTTETSEARPNTINTEKSTIRALTSKIACSTDWNYVFTEIKNDKKCELYTDLFENAYPVYIEYNNMLTKVYDEFAELKKAYKNAEPEDKVEKYVKLQQLHERYESDADFYKCRQDHHELHSKLEALRKRIVEYNQKQ